MIVAPSHDLELLRFRTDANQGSVEKLNVMDPNKSMLEDPYKEMPQLEEGRGPSQVLDIFFRFVSG